MCRPQALARGKLSVADAAIVCRAFGKQRTALRHREELAALRSVERGQEVIRLSG
jgi:hypothetical protein